MKKFMLVAVFVSFAIPQLTQGQTISTEVPGDGTGGTTAPTVSSIDLLQTALAPGEGTVGNDYITGGTIGTDPKTGQGIYASWLGNDSDNPSLAFTSTGADSLTAHRNNTGLSNAATLSDGVWGNEASTSRGTAVLQDDEFIEYTFDLSSAPLGYDITGIDVYSNWGSGPARDEINFEVQYSLVDTPDVFDQALFATDETTRFNPDVTPDATVTTQAIMRVSDLSATGVAGLRFNFPAQETFAVGYSEIDVFGSAAASAVLGDFNEDGVVNLADLDEYNGNINLTVSEGDPLADLDLDGDGNIGSNDFEQHYSQLVQTSNGGTGTAQGDVNLDGRVDVLNDAFELVNNLGAASTSWADGDVDASGTVDVLGDAFALVQNLGFDNGGGTAASPSAAAVPEPGSLSLLGLVGLGAVIRRRR